MTKDEMKEIDRALFTSTFIGEYVEIVAKFFQTFKEETENGIIEGSGPASIKGFLLEFDDDYYYLGDDPNSVNKVIKKEGVWYIEIVENKSQYDQILDDMQVDESGGN